MKRTGQRKELKSNNFVIIIPKVGHEQTCPNPVNQVTSPGTGDRILECPYRLSQAITELLAAICRSYHVPATGLGIFIRYLVNSLAETSFGYVQRNKKTASYSWSRSVWEHGFRVVIERNDSLAQHQRKFRENSCESERAKMAHRGTQGSLSLNSAGQKEKIKAVHRMMIYSPQHKTKEYI